MVGYIPVDDMTFWLLMGVFGFILVLGMFMGGRGKIFKWLKSISLIGLVGFAMFGLVIPALVPLSGGNGGDGGFVPLFTFSIARSADCNDLTGLDAVQDCVAAAEENVRSDDKEIDVLYTIDQELVTLIAPDEFAYDFAIERYCEGNDDPIHCPRGDDGDYLPASVDVAITSVPTVHNLTISDDIDLIQTVASGVDIVAWSDQTNVVLGKHTASPLQLEPGQEGTITFAAEADPNFFGADSVDDEMTLGTLKLSIAGQNVDINQIVVSYTA